MAKDDKKNQTEVKPNPRKVKAVTKYLRIAPRKLKIVIDTIRRRPVIEAMGVLSLLNKKGAKMAAKTLKSAVANAKNLGLNEDRLYVSDARADGGPSLKRFLTRSMGRADKILKRTSHLTLEVREGMKFWGGKKPEDANAKNKKKTAVAQGK